jgi:RimJ/RimL family protein N-acetyltransferase
MVARYGSELEREGWGFWAVDVAADGDGDGGDGSVFAGMVGLHRVNPALPSAPAVEVGWRLHPDHWGHGYASEAARASVEYGFEAGGLDEIVAFTTTINVRSQAVMERIGMRRDVDGDFDHPGVPVGSPLRRHVLYRISAPHDTRSVAT